MYLPTIQESLSALKRAMDAEVIPFIDDNYVQTQAKMVSTELGLLAWLLEMLPGFLAKENEERRQGLQECARSVAAVKMKGSDNVVDSLVEEVDTQLTRSYLPEVTIPRLEDLAMEHQHLGDLMERAIDVLEALRVQHPGSQAISDARQALRKVIVAEAGRRKIH
jgi:hypothetical protein